MVRSLSRFAAAVAVLFSCGPVYAESVASDSASALEICLERAAALGPVECLISQHVELRTRGSEFSGGAIVDVVLPAGPVVDVVLRFAEPAGCLVWNHSGTEPTSIVSLVRMTAGPGTAAGSRVLVVGGCLREQRSGVPGGAASTHLVGLELVGDEAADVDLVVRGDLRTDLYSSATPTAQARFEPALELDSGIMTWATLDRLERLQRFEGLDQSIPWTKYYIDPYRGSDANSGRFDSPIRSIGEWKRRARFGDQWIVKNGGRGRAMYFSNQTFPYTVTSGTCIVGEQISHNATHDSEILDIDYDAQVMVVRSLTATALASSTAFTGDASGCSWSTGTRDETLIGNAASLVCESDPNVPCTDTTQCTAALLTDNACVVDAVAGINVGESPARYAGRVVTVIEPEDPTQPVRIHGDGTSIGGSGALGTGGGIFYATTNTANTPNTGCLGVIGIEAVAVADDIVSQTAEGCVRGLSVGGETINSASATNLNVYTTHQGALGGGGIAVVNGFGTSRQYNTTGGAAGAFTGDAYAILIGRRDIVLDLGSSVAAGGSQMTPLVSTGGNLTLIGHATRCANVSSYNCAAFDLIDTSTATVGRTVTLNLIRNLFLSVLPNINTPMLDLIPSTAVPVLARIYRPTFDGAGNAIRFSGNSARVTLDVKGAIFERELNFFLLDAGTSPSNVTLSVDGVYDEHTGGGNLQWFANSLSFSTLAAFRASPTVAAAGWRVHLGESVQTDITNEVSTSGSFQCLPTSECFDSYDEPFSFAFPVALYDYLPNPIRGYSESGLRSYGAR